MAWTIQSSGNPRTGRIAQGSHRGCRAAVGASVAVVVAAVGFSPSVHAQVHVSPTTGHAYERVLQPMTWDQARAAARARTYNGKHGYLATITTAEEQNITRFSLGGDTAACWLGGRQAGGPEPAGGWVWDNGEPWDSTWWTPGTPDNSTFWTGNEENHLMIAHGGGFKLWDDWWGGDNGSLAPLTPESVRGYIVEWDCVEVTLTGPEAVAICPGGTVSFSVVAMGTGPFTYAWHKGGTPINTVSNPSAATATLILTNVSAADSGTYGCSATGVCTNWASNPATLTVSCSNRADVAGLGNSPGCDGQVTVDDIVYFLSQFFANTIAVADIVGVGGVGPPEGAVTVDDLVAFLNSFFTGCA